MDFKEKNSRDWKSVLESVFPKGIPNQSEWLDLDQIVNILDTLGSINSLNHMFYPSGYSGHTDPPISVFVDP